MKLIDCFIFGFELDLLELRLQELYEVVDQFVLVESTETIQRRPKPLLYADNRERFHPFADKIVHLIDDEPVTPPAESFGYVKERETHQRNYLARGLGQAEAGDLILLADVDEIWNREQLLECRPGGRYYAASQTTLLRGMLWNRCYYLDCLVTGLPLWGPAVMLPYHLLAGMTPNAVRYRWLSAAGKLDLQIPHAGWHFSYFGGVPALQRKIETFSEAMRNQAIYKTPEHLQRCLAAPCDIFGRAEMSLRFAGQDEFLPLPGTVAGNLDYYRRLRWFRPRRESPEC
jgi:hypothetical protein